jgi:histidinol dehydrogenase
MIQVAIHPPRSEWEKLAMRPESDVAALFDTVRPVLEAVKREGDAAVIRYGEQFDRAVLTGLRVSEAEIRAAESLLPDDLKQAIRTAAQHIETFHAAQRFAGIEVETAPGVVCRQKAVAIEKVGLYVPGGTAPLFSTVLMLAIPARIAGCREIVLCTPPRKDGSVHPAILFAASVAGVHHLFKAGGIQAVAAMAYGTETVPKVYKIFGPGNRYVTAAKQWVSLCDVAIDMPAGPSEAEVIADAGANPVFIATDFLSQAEHGADSQSILLTDSEQLAAQVIRAVEEQLALLPRREITAEALRHSRILVLRDRREMIDFTNLYAPEHLLIQTEDYASLAEEIVNAGSIFLGAWTPESAGDYASGTNHTLPTHGYARAYSGVNLDSFIRKISLQEITPEGIRQLGETIRIMAAGEQLDAHRNAVTVRLQTINKRHE